MAWNPPQFLSIFMWIGIGGIVSATAGPLVVGALWRRATKPGAITSLLVGTLSYWYIYLPIGLGVSNPTAATGSGVLLSMITMVVFTLVAGNKNQMDTESTQKVSINS